MIAQPFSSLVTSYCFRLKPGQDLKKELLYYAQVHHLHAAVLISAVGSLKNAHLRLSGHKEATIFKGPFEIVSLMGTLTAEGLHMHISVSDQEGRVVGGHLMDGCEIHTTAEIVLLENTELVFKRELDPATSYKELNIHPRT